MPDIHVITAADDLRVRRLLARRDPRLAPLIKHVGRCRLPDSRTHHPFVSLVRALTSQQLSTKAAATIFGRVVDLVGGPEALTSTQPAGGRSHEAACRRAQWPEGVLRPRSRLAR